jgi:hypothetical protein
MTKTEFRKESPAGRWAVTVPVPASEQQGEIAQGAWQGSQFQPERLRVSPGWRDEAASYHLSGPNVRGDGNLGNRDLSREVTKADAEKSYPAAMAEARAALAELAGMIRADAERAEAEIRRAIG